MYQELILSALHMFDIPDVDFLVHPGDGGANGYPAIQTNIDVGHPHAGFAAPYGHWRDALGPIQQAALMACLEARYPPSTRIPKAVWRGTSTDKAGLLSEANLLAVARSRIALMGQWYPDIFDAGYAAFSQVDLRYGSCASTMLPHKNRINLEDFNKYAIIIDVDGNAWSDRFWFLAHYNTLILKQASNMTAYFEHLLAPKQSIELFANDVRELPARVEELLAEHATRPLRILHMTETKQAIASLALSQVGTIEAMASALATVASLSEWQPVQQDDYELVPFSQCCKHNTALPKQFIDAVRSHAPRGHAAA